MRTRTLVLRSLAWFWRTNLPAALGAAVAVSVLAGALIVGDSVRSSLRRLALERLGATDVIVTAPTFAREALADDLRRASGAIRSSAPLVALDAVVTHTPSGRRAGSVQVFGVPDPKYGEEVCAWIVLRPGEQATAEEVQEFCRDQIAHYKVPKHIRFVDELPMTVTGKVQKFVMRERMIDELKIAADKTA